MNRFDRIDRLGISSRSENTKYPSKRNSGLPLNSSVDTPPISMTLNIAARASPSSICVHSSIAAADRPSSTRIPAPDTKMRRHLLVNAAEAEAST